MTKRRAGRGSKYSDDFKRQLVAESYAAGVSVPMVAKKHGVGTERIYTWRGDARFQPDAPEDMPRSCQSKWRRVIQMLHLRFQKLSQRVIRHAHLR